MAFMEKHLRNQIKELRTENEKLKDELEKYKKLEASLKVKEATLENQLDSLRLLERQWSETIEQHRETRKKFRENMDEAQELILMLTEAKQEMERRKAKQEE